VKVGRARQQKKDRTQVFKERTDNSYGAGVGLNAGIRKKRKLATSASAKLCKCGSNTHQRTTHKECPLNKKRTAMVNDSAEKNTININDNTQSTSLLESSQCITYPTPISLQSISDDSEVDGYESERTTAVRLMVSNMCLGGDETDDSDLSDGS
jgi:hypothetical protein